MTFAKSKITAQGQISVPAEVRKKLGVGPGSVLEWEEQDQQVIVRRAGGRSLEEIHRLLFPKGGPKKAVPLRELKDGIRKYIRKRHARG